MIDPIHIHYTARITKLSKLTFREPDKIVSFFKATYKFLKNIFFYCRKSFPYLS